MKVFGKIKNHPHFDPKQFSDIRNIGLVAFGFLALLVSWSGAKVIQQNYELQKQISALQQQNEIQQLENENLKLKNAYFNTDQYLELAARREFSKAAPDEKVILVPKSIALKYTVDLPETKEEAETVVEQAKPWYQRNLEAWRQFLFR